MGERRIVYPWLGGGACRRCKTEDDNLCANQRSLGVVQNGGFASRARLAKEGLLPPLPLTLMPKDDANVAMIRRRDSKVTGRIILTVVAS